MEMNKGWGNVDERECEGQREIKGEGEMGEL